MDSADAWHSSEPHRTQQVEAVFQILFVDVDHIGLKCFPFARYMARSTPIEPGRKRARRVIVGVTIIGPHNAGKASAFIREFVHAGMIWNPHENFMAAVGQPPPEIVEEDFSSTPGAGATADQKYLHNLVRLPFIAVDGSILVVAAPCAMLCNIIEPLYPVIFRQMFCISRL